jgi:acetolactate synthase regulatory subunit
MPAEQLVRSDAAATIPLIIEARRKISLLTFPVARISSDMRHVNAVSSIARQKICRNLALCQSGRD